MTTSVALELLENCCGNDRAAPTVLIVVSSVLLAGLRIERCDNLSSNEKGDDALGRVPIDGDNLFAKTRPARQDVNGSDYALVG